MRLISAFFDNRYIVFALLFIAFIYELMHPYTIAGVGEGISYFFSEFGHIIYTGMATISEFVITIKDVSLDSISHFSNSIGDNPSLNFMVIGLMILFVYWIAGAALNGGRSKGRS